VSERELRLALETRRGGFARAAKALAPKHKGGERAVPKDEVFHGHPLHGKGLVVYRPLRVLNSTWIREFEAINSVHRQFKADRWNTLSHYIFGFPDCTFECVAQSFVLMKSSGKKLRLVKRSLYSGPPQEKSRSSFDIYKLVPFLDIEWEKVCNLQVALRDYYFC